MFIRVLVLVSELFRTLRKYGHPQDENVTPINLKKLAGIYISTLKFVSFRPELGQSIASFRVTPFKIDQNQNRSIDKVQNLGKERR